MTGGHLVRWRSLSPNTVWVWATFAVSRSIIILMMFFSRRILTRGPHNEYFLSQARHGGTLLDIFTQWDGVWYRMIAEQGYGMPTPPPVIVFFPFYPILVQIAAFFVRDFQIASLLVSNGCLVAAALLFDRLLRLDYDEETCRRAITFLMFNPASFFFSMAYTESTFLLLSIAALLAARRGKWFVACLCGMCLSATRPPGLLIAAPLLLEYTRPWRISRAHLRAMLHPRLFLFGLIPLGLGFYMLYCHFVFGDLFRPLRAQVGWSRAFTPPYQTFFNPQNFSPSHLAFYRSLIVAAFGLLALGVINRLRASYWAYAMVSVLFYLSWTSLDGMPRYLSVIFPLYVVLALVTQRTKWLYEPLLTFSIALLVLCAVLFANGYQMT